MKLRTLIVDDEALARQILREFLSTHPEVEVVGECANGFDAVKAALELKPDLLFLDIQMPKLDGFEVLELIGDGPVVVFVTAFDTHAIRAFEVHAVDYLLKPFSTERLRAALERACLRRAALRAGTAPPTASALELAAAARPPAQFADRIVVRDGTRVTIIPLAKLDYAEAQDDYVALCTEGKKHLKQQTLASLEHTLDPTQFLRVHRSYIVQLSRVAKIEPYGKDSHRLYLSTGAELPVSRAGYARLREVLER